MRTLSLNTATIGFQCPLARVTGACAAAGLGCIAPLRLEFSRLPPRDARERIADSASSVTGLCRGGYLVYSSAGERSAVLDDNRRAIDEAQALDAIEAWTAPTGSVIPPPGENGAGRPAARTYVASGSVVAVQHGGSAGNAT
jgi:sugar phosphate isomerase/epimerase